MSFEIGQIANLIDSYALQRINLEGRQLGISVNNTCPIACRHCITNAVLPKAGSDGSPEQLASEVIAYYSSPEGIEAQTHFDSICLTGGEALLSKTAVRSYIDFFHHSFGKSFGNITSAFWASTPQKAADVFDRWPEIKSWTFSTDLFHTEFVPLRNIENACNAARQRGHSFDVRITTSGDSRETELIEQVRSFCPDISFQEIVLAGRWEDKTKGASDQTEDMSFLPCPAKDIHVTAKGRIYPCCNDIIDMDGRNHVFDYGSVGDCGASLRNLDADPVLRFVKIWGWSELLKIVGHQPDQGTSKALTACALCRSVISDSNLNARLNALRRISAFEKIVADGENTLAKTARH